jgi:hypothetical protein
MGAEAGVDERRICLWLLPLAFAPFFDAFAGFGGVVVDAPRVALETEAGPTPKSGVSLWLCSLCVVVLAVVVLSVEMINVAVLCNPFFTVVFVEVMLVVIRFAELEVEVPWDSAAASENAVDKFLFNPAPPVDAPNANDLVL